MKVNSINSNFNSNKNNLTQKNPLILQELF